MSALPLRLAAPAAAALVAAALIPACTSRDVVGVAVGSVSVSPPTATMVVGETRSFSAVARDEEGSVIPGTTFTWSISGSSVLSVTPEGRVEAVGPGEAQVRASSGGVTGSATVVVEPPPSIVPTPAGVTLFAAVGGESPEPEIVQVTNGGAGALTGLAASVSYAAGQQGGWLSPSLSSSTAPAELTLTPSTTSLPTGEYEATVLLASPVAVNTPVTIDVQLFVIEDRAIIRLVPSAVGIAAVSGGAPAPPQVVDVRNDGGGTIAGLSTSIIYLDGGGWLTATLAGTSAPTQVTLRADPGALAPGTYRATVEVVSPDALNSPRSLPVTFTVEAEPEADLVAGKSGPSNITVGDTATFVLTVTNEGPRNATATMLEDSLPDGFDFVEASGDGIHAGGVVTWAIGALATGGSVEETVRAVATTVGSWANVARTYSATLDPEEENDRAEWGVSVQPMPADLSIVKTGGGSAAFGDTVTYVLTTENDGPGPASGVVVTDSLPGALTFVSASDGATVGDGVVSWDVGTLSAGGTRVHTVRARVDASGSHENVARVSGSTPDPTGSNDRSTVTTSVDRLADVSVTKAGPDTVGLGETVEYVLEVRNAGPDSASSVVLRDSLPAGFAFVSASGAGSANGRIVTWPAAPLGPGQSRSETVRASADALGSWVNVARASGGTADPDIDDLRATVQTAVVGSDLSVTKAAPDAVSSGDTIVYVLRVRNDGPGDAPSVVLTDSLPGGLDLVSTSAGANVSGGRVVTWSKGTIPAGVTRADTIRAVAEGGGPFVNVARVSGGLADPDDDDRRATTSTEVLPADLSIEKTGPSEASIGQTVTYEITLDNDGPGRATGITVVDSLPGGIAFLSASGSPSVSGSVLTWTREALEAGASETFTVRVLALVFGERTNIVRASAGTADPDEDDLRDQTTTSVGGADLSVSKTGPDKIGVGDTIVYLLGIANEGPNDASDVVLTDSLPPATTVVGTSAGASVGTAAVTWSKGTVPAGATRVDTLRLVPNTTGPIDNVVRVRSETTDSDTTDLRAELRTVVTGSDLSLAKDGPTSAIVGDTLSYVLTVTSAGPDPATDVLLVDSLPPGTTFASATGGGVHSGMGVTWSLGTLPPGATRAETLKVVANVASTPTNVARVSSSTADPDTNDLRATASTTVSASADLSVSTNATPAVLEGETIEYVLQVTNAGPSPAGSVTLVDSLPAGVTFVSTTGGGSHANGLVTWSKGTLPSGTTTTDTVRVTATAVGVSVNVARVGSVTADPDANDLRATASTTVSASADLSVAKTGPESAVVGGTIEYVLKVSNIGPSPAESVSLVDSLPAGVAFSSATGGGTHANGVVTWTKGTVGAGNTVADTLRVVATNAVTLTNVARASSTTSDPDAGDLRDTAFTSVGASADLSVSTSATPSVTVGGTIEYVLRVTNAGPNAAASVTLTDSLPAGVTFVSATGGGSHANGVVTWSKGTLPNATVTADTLRVTADQAGTPVNVVRVSSTTPDPDAGDLRAQASTNVSAPPPAPTAAPGADDPWKAGSAGSPG